MGGQTFLHATGDGQTSSVADGGGDDDVDGEEEEEEDGSEANISTRETNKLSAEASRAHKIV